MAFNSCAPRDDAQLGEPGFERAQVGVLLTEKSHQVETFERKNGFMHVEDKSSFLTFAFVTPITLISDFGSDNMYVGLQGQHSQANARGANRGFDPQHPEV